MSSSFFLRPILQVSASVRNGLTFRVSSFRLLSNTQITLAGDKDGGGKGGDELPPDEEALKVNPYFEKYEEKIEKVKAKEGPRMRRKTLKTDNRLKQEMEKWKRHQDMLEGKFSSAAKKEDPDARGSKLPSSLNELMKLELLMDKTSEEITTFWNEYYKNQDDTVYAVILGDTWRTMQKLSVESRTFLYPLPKEQGYEFILSSWAKNRCFFTSLINYQTHGENAPWQLCLTHYPDLLDSHNIVLMTSELDATNLNVVEARFVTLLAQKFYSADDDNYKLVHQFNHNPQNFKFMDIIKAVDQSNMSANPKEKNAANE